MNSASSPIRTGIYGGSFNPIHIGHVALAKQILKAANLDEVWFVVSPQNPFKRQRDLMPDEQRLEWVRQALADELQLFVSDYEFHLPKPSYTWNTLQHLHHDYPNRQFCLIIGADNWLSFPQWAHHEDILRDHDIFIYPRRNNPIDATTLPSNVHLLKTELYDTSSSEIRRRMQAGENVDQWLPFRLK